jgi:hypothetical protein
MRLLQSLGLALLMLSPAAAQEDPGAWQDAVTGQIEALRAHDSEAALGFAAEAFRTQFAESPETFYQAIVASGYGPIAQSRSHSFGETSKVSDTLVTQVVNVTGFDGKLYQAIYQLADEPEQGWRVVAVALRPESGIGI